MANWLDKFDDGGDVPSNKGTTIYTTNTPGSYFSPTENTVYLNSQDARNPSVLPHELHHYNQWLNGGFSVDTDTYFDELKKQKQLPENFHKGNFSDNLNYNIPLRMPSIAEREENQNNFTYYNRRPVEQEALTNNFLFHNPSFNLVDSGLVYDKKINPLMYETPWTLEGEAQQVGNQYIGPYKQGGLIKRADGSYSRRGLWDNIRANKGSGRKPTAEMLRQERKIKKHADGGLINMYAEGDIVGEDPKPVTPTSTPISYNINDFYITPDEIELYKQRAEECHSKGQCLEQAFRFYDKYVAPNLGTPNSWDIKKNAGISSGATNPNFNQYGESADSWDIHGLLQEKGATKILAANVKNPMSIEQNLSKMTPSQQEDYFISLNIPLGSVIGMGSSGTNKSSTSYNSKLGLVDSNHSASVIGYNERGVPMIFDYGEIKPITSRTFTSDAFPITNITAPKETAQYTYEYLKANNKLQNDYTPLNLKTNTTEYDEDEYIPFIDALKNNKAKYANAFGLTNTEYDELAKKAAALALTETGGGDDATIRWKGLIPIPSYLTDKLGIGDTTGITQINSDMIFNSKELSKKLEAVGITKDNYDPWNSDHIAAATIALLKSNVRPAERAYNINTQKLGYDPGLSDAAITYYQWNQPSLLIKGEAKGESEKVKKFQNNYNLIDIGDYLQLNPEGTPSINLPEVKVEYKKGDGSWVNMYGNGSKVTTNKPPQKTLKQALLDYKENADENKWEFVDPTGITSWDDAARGYNAWQKSGRTLPTLTESMDMFSAVPLLGKAKQIETGIKHTVQSARKIPWNKIYGAVDYLRDEYNDKIKKHDEGSWVTDSSLPQPTTPSFYPAYPDRTLTNYQMDTDKAPMYGGGGGIKPFITSDPNLYKQRQQAYADSAYAHNVGLANWKNAQLKLKQNVDKFNAQLPSAFGHIIGPSAQLDTPRITNNYYSPVPIRGIWPTKAAHQYTVPHQYLSELQYLNLYHNPSFYEPLTGDALKSYNQNHTGIFYFPYDEADKYHASVNLYDAPKQQVIFDKNAPENKITKTVKSLPTPVKNNTEIKKEDIEPVTRKFDFSVDEDIQPIAPTPYVPNPVRRILNPSFQQSDYTDKHNSIVDPLGNPKYKYYNQDKVITQQEYDDLMQKKANGGGVKPYITSDINDYNYRKQAYADSALVAKIGQEWVDYMQNPNTTGDMFNDFLKKQDNYKSQHSNSSNYFMGGADAENKLQSEAIKRLSNITNEFGIKKGYNPIDWAIKDFGKNTISGLFSTLTAGLLGEGRVGTLPIYQKPVQAVIYKEQKNKDIPQPPKPHSKEYIEPIKRNKTEFKDIVLPTEEYDMQPIREEAPQGSLQPMLRMAINPKFNVGAGKRTKEAVVDALGNPRNVYYYGDKVISKEEYSKLWDAQNNKFAQGEPVMYNAGSTVWTKQDTPLWAAGTPTPTATQNFRNDRSLNTDLYRIGDVIPTGMDYKTPAAGTYDYNKDVQPYHTMRLHAPDTTMMAKHGSHVTSDYKKRVGIPYAISPGVSNEGMYVGPTSQRGITFADGGYVKNNNSNTWLDQYN